MGAMTSDAVVTTRFVSVRTRCPRCGAQIVRPYGTFDENALWYGPKPVMECPKCNGRFVLGNVESDR